MAKGDVRAGQQWKRRDWRQSPQHLLSLSEQVTSSKLAGGRSFSQLG